MTAILGDFLNRASDHIDAAVCDPRVPAPETLPALTRELGRFVAVMIGHLSDMIPPTESATGRQQLPPELRAALDMRITLRKAVHSLRPDTTSASGTGTHQTDVPTWHMSQAATHLTAARDLLHTHFASNPDGVWSHTSPWAAALKSPPVTIALLAHLGKSRARAIGGT